MSGQIIVSPFSNYAPALRLSVSVLLLFQIVLGKVVQKEAKLDQQLAKELVGLGKRFPFKTVFGTTVCTNDFYEGQARLDGAFCAYSKQDKLDYLQFLKENGVSNIEMESTCFAALTHQAGIRSAVVCVALLDRLNEDQVLMNTLN